MCRPHPGVTLRELSDMLLLLHSHHTTGCLDEGAHDIVREVVFELLKVGRHTASWAREGLPLHVVSSALRTGLASDRQGVRHRCARLPSAAEDVLLYRIEGPGLGSVTVATAQLLPPASIQTLAPCRSPSPLPTECLGSGSTAKARVTLSDSCCDSSGVNGAGLCTGSS